MEGFIVLNGVQCIAPDDEFPILDIVDVRYIFSNWEDIKDYLTKKLHKEAKYKINRQYARYSSYKTFIKEGRRFFTGWIRYYGTDNTEHTDKYMFEILDLHNYKNYEREV